MKGCFSISMFSHGSPVNSRAMPKLAMTNGRISFQFLYRLSILLFMKRPPTFPQSHCPVCQHSQEHENEPDRRLGQKQVSDDLTQPRVIHGLHIVIDRLCIPAGEILEYTAHLPYVFKLAERTHQLGRFVHTYLAHGEVFHGGGTGN